MAVVRIVLGVLIAIEAANYLASDWIERSFTDPAFHFTYLGFGWVEPWPEPWLHVHFAALAVLGAAVAAGVAHRVTAPLLALGFAYVFLLEQTEYLNHFYAAILFLALIAAAPADRALSVAARRRPWRAQVVPTWSVWILRFQVGVIYLYGGIAKLGDDWLAGEPMTTWMAQRAEMWLIGPLLAAEPTGLVLAWAGAAFDLAIVPLLLWRRTRVAAFAAVIAFNLTNWVIFDIGIFPPMMIAATTIFFDPSWPRDVAFRVRGLVPVRPTPGGPPAPASAGWTGRLLVPLLALYVAVQTLVPLRHHLYPGLVHWSEEGHRFAWHMKLRQKDGDARFYAVEGRTGERRRLPTAGLITDRQYARASTHPQMLAALARELAERERARGREVEVRVRAPVSLNGREERLLVDPRRDLSQVSRGLAAADWITPEPPR